MAKTDGWEKLGELSRILRKFQHLYFHEGEAEDDHEALLLWRRDFVQFNKGLLLSYGRATQEDEGSPWVHFHFGAFVSVLTHSCCDWSSPEAYGCGLMAEAVQALLQVQSELPVCTPGIVHILLNRLATLRPGKEANGRFAALVSGLEEALDACPSMPRTAVEASLEECLRRPAGGAMWSLGATPTFIRGALSLVTRSPRSLCQAIVPVLVRFVAEIECDLNGRGPYSASDATDAAQEPASGVPCHSCVAAGAPRRTAESLDSPSPPTRCEAQEKRDLVLRVILGWAVDAHFRQCSALLQESLYRAVFDGLRQALDAAAITAGLVSPSRFPLSCRLLLSFLGGLAGDGGAAVASFLRDRCAAELRSFLARPESWTSSVRAVGKRRATTEVGASEMPALEAYVGHLCLCRHVSDPAMAGHLLWLSQQSLAVFRSLNSSSTPTPAGQLRASERAAVVLESLCHGIALLLTRPARGKGCRSLHALPDNAGSLLEIVFDSDACPLASLPRPLAEAAIGTLRTAGYLQLSRTELLLGTAQPLRSQEKQTEASEVVGVGSGGAFADGVDFRLARLAFRRSWALAAAGVNSHLPLVELKGATDKATNDDSTDAEREDSDGGELESHDDSGLPITANGWGQVPDEVTMRVFSFLTPKRVCRLACVDRAWRELLNVSRVWKPFFEARWPLRVLQSEEDLTGVSDMLLETLGPHAGGKRKRRRDKRCVVHFSQGHEDLNKTPPTRDWMVLYRDRHRAERAARGRLTARTKFPWMVCPFLGCMLSLKSEFAVKRHISTHKPKREKKKRRLATKTSRPEKAGRT